MSGGRVHAANAKGDEKHHGVAITSRPSLSIKMVGLLPAYANTLGPSTKPSGSGWSCRRRASQSVAAERGIVSCRRHANRISGASCNASALYTALRMPTPHPRRLYGASDARVVCPPSAGRNRRELVPLAVLPEAGEQAGTRSNNFACI